MLEIEVIAKGNGKIYKIVGITQSEFDKMKRKPGFTYQAYQKGFSQFADVVVLNYSKINLNN